MIGTGKPVTHWQREPGGDAWRFGCEGRRRGCKIKHWQPLAAACCVWRHVGVLDLAGVVGEESPVSGWDMRPVTIERKREKKAYHVRRAVIRVRPK